MDYLVYVEHNAENLQFYLWYKDYTRRFNELPEKERSLSPEWVPEVNDLPNLSKASEKEKGPKKVGKRNTMAAMMESGYDSKGAALFSEDKMEIGDRHTSLMKDNASSVAQSMSTSAAPSTNEVTAQVGLKWQPCTCSSSSTVRDKLLTDAYSHNSTHAR